MDREGLDSSDTENLNEVIQGIEVKDEEELADNDNNDGDQPNDKKNRNSSNNKNNDNDINDGDGSSVENSRDSRSETEESLYSDEEYTDDGEGSEYTESESTEAPSSKRQIIFVVLVIVALIGAAVGITLARRRNEEDDDNDVNSVVGTPDVPTIPTPPSAPSPSSPSLFVTLSPTEAPDTASSATLPPTTDSPVDNDNDNTPSSPSEDSNNPGPTPIEIPPNFPSPDDDGYSSIDPSKDPHVSMKFECRIDLTIFVDIDSSSVGAMSTVIEDSVRQEIGNEAKCQVTNIGGVANTRLRRSLLLSPKKRVPGRTLSITAVRFNIYHKLPCAGNGTCKREEREAETLFRDLQDSIDSSISQNSLESTIRSTASSYGLTNALTDTVIDGHDCDDNVNIEVFNQKEKQEDDDCCCNDNNKRSNNDARRYAVVRGMDKMGTSSALKKVIVNALLHE